MLKNKIARNLRVKLILLRSLVVSLTRLTWPFICSVIPPSEQWIVLWCKSLKLLLGIATQQEKWNGFPGGHESILFRKIHCPQEVHGKNNELQTKYHFYWGIFLRLWNTTHEGNWNPCIDVRIFKLVSCKFLRAKQWGEPRFILPTGLTTRLLLICSINFIFQKLAGHLNKKSRLSSALQE